MIRHATENRVDKADGEQVRRLDAAQLLVGLLSQRSAVAA